ncbi:MAG: DICT sensory domain-containing protein [Cyanobacteriota bacterium]
MSILTSVLTELLDTLPNKRPQIYFKSSLTALSHAMEDQVLAGVDQPLVIANFQRERFYRQEAHRYQRLAQKTNHVYVLAAAETEFKNHSGEYETIAFDPTDALSQEWHLVVIGQQYATCLICRERSPLTTTEMDSEVDASRRFEGIWTFERRVSRVAADILLRRILHYRPELADKIEEARQLYLDFIPPESLERVEGVAANPDPFVQRLVTYLQAGQYKLIKAYRSISAKEEKERLLHSITVAIRRSLDPHEILQVTVEKLGKSLRTCRCVVYRCKEGDSSATISHEYLEPGITPLKGQDWPLKNNPLFQEVAQRQEPVCLENTLDDLRIQDSPLEKLVKRFSIASWMLIPVLYQGRLLGMVELHHCGGNSAEWAQEDVALVEAIAAQIGVALIQAEAYANLEDLNQQLEALDRTRSNLVAITGHELRTPLSTIQVCLESLASEPDMSSELRQVMLNTALEDAERMRTLVQDFLTLSQLESGRIQWHPEPLMLQECVDLSLSNIRSRKTPNTIPQIKVAVSDDLPLVQADGEWLVEVLAKLLDNACKFTPANGTVTVDAKTVRKGLLEVIISDTGRGIERNRLETVFDRFYQEEGALRRTTGGTGLGLAICRQIVNYWHGEMWANSGGKDKGSEFHFTIPTVNPASKSSQAKSRRRSQRK